jgi:hypothetical protein
MCNRIAEYGIPLIGLMYWRAQGLFLKTARHSSEVKISHGRQIIRKNKEYKRRATQGAVIWPRAF